MTIPSMVFWGATFLAVLVFVGIARLAIPRTLREPFRDALIVAAHPDDCVISAGEYATGAVRAGRSVQVAYVTCGDASPTSERACMRRAEAIRAWSTLDVGEDRLHRLDLPESPVVGPLSAGDTDRAVAGQRLRHLLAELPRGAAVFFPALGESHVDHRMTRDLALEAALSTRRDDLRLFEVAEYNPLVSVARAPTRALAFLMGALPGLGRLVPSGWGHLPPPLARGRELRLEPDTERLQTKLTMLQKFASENAQGELLRFFGWPDRYRAVPDAGAALEERLGAYVRVDDQLLSVSTMALIGSLFLFEVGVSALLFRLGAELEPGLGVAVGVLLGAALVFGLVRSRSTSKKAGWLMMSGGAGAGLLLSSELAAAW